MAWQDGPDGFFEEHLTWGKCSHLECIGFEECLYPLGPNDHSGKGYQMHAGQKDVWQLTHGGVTFRLTKGFNMLLRSQR